MVADLHGLLVVTVRLTNADSPWWGNGGLLGLAGVALGVLVTTGKDLVFEGRRAEAERGRREAERRAIVRQAARLVTDDLHTIRAHLRSTTGDGLAPFLSITDAMLDAWVEHRGVLAAELEAVELWQAVVTGVDAARIAIHILGPYPPLAKVRDGQLRNLKECLGGLDGAIGVLAPFCRLAD